MVSSKESLRKLIEKLGGRTIDFLEGLVLTLPGDETDSVQGIEKSIGILLACSALGEAIFAG